MFSFVNDGHERACEAIRADVELKYIEQLKAVMADERKILLKKFEVELRTMIQQKAPPGGLY